MNGSNGGIKYGTMLYYEQTLDEIADEILIYIKEAVNKKDWYFNGDNSVGWVICYCVKGGYGAKKTDTVKVKTLSYAEFEEDTTFSYRDFSQKVEQIYIEEVRRNGEITVSKTQVMDLLDFIAKRHNA